MLEGLVGGARAGRAQRHGDLGQELPGPQRRQEGAEEELVGRHLPLIMGRAPVEDRIEREHDRGQVRGGIGMGEAAAHRAAVPDLEVADALCAVDERGERRSPQFLRLCEIAPGRERSDPEVSVALRYSAELELADVDEQPRPDQPQLQDRDERLAAGERLRVRLGERAERIVERLRAHVLELGRDHPSLPAAAAALIASTIPW